MPVCFVAEIDNNHNGDVALAKTMVDAAIVSGADYVKFQIYRPDLFMSKSSAYYGELSAEALPFEAFTELKAYVEQKNSKFLATPFDSDSLRFLHDLGCAEIKIASGDFDNFDLLAEATDLKKRVIMSVGGGLLEEIDRTVAFLKDRKADFMLLHCALAYPADFSDLNLRFIPTLRSRYGVPIGYSDHSPGSEAGVAAVALGAELIEKHFTTDRGLPGGDNGMSINPEELTRMVRECRNIEIGLGIADRLPTATERTVRALVKRTYHASRDLAAGTVLSDTDLILLRPEDSSIGFTSGDKQSLVGRILAKRVAGGDVILPDTFNDR